MEASEGRDVVSAPPAPTLTVAAVARRLGVAPPTLRTWDRRYGLGPSAHTAGAHRRYSPADVARLMVMRRLTLEGVPPSDAARIALATPVSPEGRPVASVTRLDERRPDAGEVRRDRTGRPARPDGAGLPSYDVKGGGYDEPDPAGGHPNYGPDYQPSLDRAHDPEANDTVFGDVPDDGFDGAGVLLEADHEASESLWQDDPGPEIDTPWRGAGDRSGDDRGSAGGGRVVALPEGTPQTRGLARAAMSLDSQQTARLLRDALRRTGVVATWDMLVTPVLRALGERTGATGDGIDVEHAFSETLLAVLRGPQLHVRQPRNPAPVLLVCAETDHHTLPLHALAAALAERDICARMLGGGMPPHALAAAVRRSGPCAVLLYAQMPGAHAGYVEELRRQRPSPRILLGGPGWLTGTIPAPVRRVGSLTAAIEEIELTV